VVGAELSARLGVELGDIGASVGAFVGDFEGASEGASVGDLVVGEAVPCSKIVPVGPVVGLEVSTNSETTSVQIGTVGEVRFVASY
jgi:hypothetical protein